jgi:two-component system, response regulator, stage 0 sporulation protein F
MATPVPLPPAIVLAEDEPEVRIILQRMLAHIADSYELVAVETGAAALAALAERPVPLLITDYNMLGMTGLELAQKVKATAPATMVVLVSAYATPLLEKRALAAGADYFLPKPFAFDQLETIVRQALAE